MKLVLRPILPQLPPAEFYALVESIREHGVRCPIHVTPVKGKPDSLLIVDGHERCRAADVAGVRLKDIPFLVVGDLDESERDRMAISLNAHRRHLTFRQRRELLERYFLADPRASVRDGRSTRWVVDPHAWTFLEISGQRYLFGGRMTTLYAFGDTIFDRGRYHEYGVHPGGLIVRNDDGLFPEFRCRDLASRGPACLEHRAVDGATFRGEPR